MVSRAFRPLHFICYFSILWMASINAAETSIPFPSTPRHNADESTPHISNCESLESSFFVKFLKINWQPFATYNNINIWLWPYRPKHIKKNSMAYTDRASAACRRSDCQLLRLEGAMWSAWRIPWSAWRIPRPYSRFSRQEPLLFYQVAPQLYSRGWMDPVPDPLLFFPDSAGNRTRASESVAKNSDH
jgi:hypothetical protein